MRKWRRQGVRRRRRVLGRYVSPVVDAPSCLGACEVILSTVSHLVPLHDNPSHTQEEEADHDQYPGSMLGEEDEEGEEDGEEEMQDDGEDI